MKRCSKCGATKPLSDFHKHKDSSDGHTWRCKVCRHQARQRYHQKKHREEIARRAVERAEHDRLFILGKKQCCQCGEIKPLSGFHGRRDSLDGHRSQCKDCLGQIGYRYRQEHADEKAAYDTVYRQDHKDKLVARRAAWYQENKEEITTKQRGFYQEHKDAILSQVATYRRENPEKVAAQRLARYQKKHQKEIARRVAEQAERDRLFALGKKQCSKCGKIKSLSDFSKRKVSVDGYMGLCKECVRRKGQRYRQENPEKVAAQHALYNQEHPEMQRAIQVRRKARMRDAAGDASGAQRKARAEVYGGLCYLCGNSATAMDHVIPLAKGGSNWPANLRPICNRCNSIKGARWPYDIETHRQQHEAMERVT